MILENSFRSFRTIMCLITLLTCINSDEQGRMKALKYEPLNNPILPCMFAMDAFSPVIYDGYDCFVISKELTGYLRVLSQEQSSSGYSRILSSDHGSLGGKINEMIAYIEAYCQINKKQKFIEAFRAIIALSKGNLDESMRKYLGPDGRSIVFELGFAGHSMKGEVIMDENKPENFILNVYNSGGGLSEFHPTQQYSKGRRIRYAPYVSFFAKASDLDEKFVNLLLEVKLFPGFEHNYFNGKATKPKDLYVNTLSTLLIQRKNVVYNDFISSQRAGSCTLSSWHAFFTAKFGYATYAKIKLAIAIGILKRQLSNPEFDFMNHDYSDSERFDYDFHVEGRFMGEGNSEYLNSFIKHFPTASYLKGSPKRTTKRDTMLAYEQIIRWLHRQSKKIFGGGNGKTRSKEHLDSQSSDKDDKKKLEVPRESPELEESVHYSLIKEDIQEIEELFKTRRDEYISSESKAKRVAFNFESIRLLRIEDFKYMEGNRVCNCLEDAVKTKPAASYYFICTWKGMDEFIDSCERFIEIRKQYPLALKENPLYLASYVFYLSEQIVEATKRWEGLPEYKEGHTRILDAIYKLGMCVLTDILLEDRNAVCIPELKAAYSSLIGAYFNIWKYHHVNAANAGADGVNEDIKRFEAMLKGVLNVPISNGIDLTGRERPDNDLTGRERPDKDLTGRERPGNDVEDYCFYARSAAEGPETGTVGQIKLDNLIRYENANERGAVVAVLFQLAKDRIKQNLGLELEESACTADAREALITAVLVSTVWMITYQDFPAFIKIDGYYYKLLDMIKLFDELSNGKHRYEEIVRIEIKSGPSGIERLSTRFFGPPPFRDSSQFNNGPSENTEESALDMECYLDCPSYITIDEGRNRLYKYILDKNSLRTGKNLEEYRRGMEVLNGIFNDEMKGLNDEKSFEEKEYTLGIMAQFFLVIKRMRASIKTANTKDSDVKISDDVEKLKFSYVELIKRLALEGKGQKELEYLSAFLEAAGEEIGRSAGRSSRYQSRPDIVKIHNIISKNLGILEKYVHRSEIFAFIPRFYERYAREISEFEIENGEEFEFYPYRIPGCDALGPPSGSTGELSSLARYLANLTGHTSSSVNHLDNRVNISHFGDNNNMHQKVVCKDNTFIINKHGVFCNFQTNEICYLRPLKSSIASAHDPGKANLSPLFGSREKLYFIEVPGDQLVYGSNALGRCMTKIILRNGHEYGRIFRHIKDRQHYFELVNREAFCLEKYAGNGVFRMGTPSLKERVQDNEFDETCVKSLPLIDNFAQGTSVLTLAGADGNRNSFYFLAIYSGDEGNCFIHCDEPQQKYNLYFGGRKYKILDIRVDDAGNATVENRKYYELPILFVKPDNSTDDNDDSSTKDTQNEKIFMVCPTNLIQDDKPGCDKLLNTQKLVFIECRCSTKRNEPFTPIIRNTFHAAVLFRVYLEYKMYVEALECLLQINLFSMDNSLITGGLSKGFSSDALNKSYDSDSLKILERVIKHNEHRDAEAYFFRAAAGYMIKSYNTCSKLYGFRPTEFHHEYSQLESIHSLLPGYMQCLSRSLFIDFQDLKFSQIFMHHHGLLNIFKNNKDILRGKLEKTLKEKIISMLGSTNGSPSPLSNALVEWVQRDLASGKSLSSPLANKMPEFMRNLKSPEDLETYCRTTFKKSFYDENIFTDLINEDISHQTSESTVLWLSTKREYMKYKSKALYNELYNAAKSYLESSDKDNDDKDNDGKDNDGKDNDGKDNDGKDNDDKPDTSSVQDKNKVVKNALTSYWEKEIAKVHDPLLLTKEEVVGSFIATKYDHKFSRHTNKLFREDLSLETGESSAIELEEIVAQAENEYNSIDKSTNLKLSMDSLLKDRDDFLRKKLSQRILLGMNTDELKRHFKAQDPESLYRAIWRRFIEENQARSETVRAYTLPSSRTLSMIDKIILILCGHAENEADVLNVGKADGEALRHIVGELEKRKTYVKYKSANISKLRVLVPCLTLYATHKMHRIPIIVLSSSSINKNTPILQEVLKRAFGKSVFRINLAQEDDFYRKDRLFSLLILLRTIRESGDVLICTQNEISCLKLASSMIRENYAFKHGTEIKLVAEILRMIEDESLGIIDDDFGRDIINLKRTVKFIR